MTTQPQPAPFDPTTKLLLTLLAAVTVGALVVLVWPFLHPAIPAESANTAPAAAVAIAETVETPSAGAPVVAGSHLYHAPPLLKTNAHEAMVQWVNRIPLTERLELARRQSDYLRRMAIRNNGRVPGGPTMAEINDMERKGEIAW